MIRQLFYWVWCWALDICPRCEQTSPYHKMTCPDFSTRKPKALDTA
jgi:hypothetical protein